MVRFTVTAVGLNRVLGNFKQLEFNLPQTSDEISETIAKRIQRRAKENLLNGIQYKRHTPGLVAGTIASATNRKGQWIVNSQAFDDQGRDYAPFVEFGTSPHSSEGFLRLPVKLRKGWLNNSASPFITHPGTYKSRTTGFFRRAIEQTKQEEKGIGESKVKQTIKRSGFK